jgi:hypothetical protein
MASKNERSARKGKATEQLIAASCVLATGAELNALTALVDDEGVDVSFKRRNGGRTIDVQVKARFSDEDGSKALRDKGTFVSDVREETFEPRDDLYMLYVAVNGAAAEIEVAWLVPSHDLASGAFSVNVKGKQRIRFQASAKDTSEDKWTPYRMTREDLPQQILALLEQVEPTVPDDDELADDDLDEGEDNPPEQLADAS